jgi:trimethylamine:corrinoid methyltransferase-like protein
LLTFDYAKLIMDAELIRMITRVVKGIDVSDGAVALDVIQQVGPGGEFVTHDHTYDHMRELSQSTLFDRNMRDVWVAAGGKTLLSGRTKRYGISLDITGQYHCPKVQQKLCDQS